MNIKDKIASFFLRRINTDLFSRLVKKYSWLQPPYKFFAQRLIDWQYPRHLFVETTSLCNLHCKMCPRNFTAMKLGTMDMELFKKIVDEAKQFKARTFSLHLFGEPLLDKGLIEKIDYIKKANSENSIILTTNGVLLNNGIAEGIIKAGVDKIAISIHSPDKDIYQDITGVNCLADVEKNMLGLIKLKEELGINVPKIFLRLIRMVDNASQVDSFIAKWKDLPVQIEIRDEHNYGGRIKNNPLKSTSSKRYPCYHLWLSPGINWDGEVTICCDDVARQAVLGNIKNESLNKIWRGEKINQYRAYHLKGEYDKISICANCDVWDIYPDIFFDYQKK